MFSKNVACYTKPVVTRQSNIRSYRKKIVCIGDSLTVCGGKGGRYIDWLGQHLRNCEIIPKGVSGNTLSGGRARFYTDVLDLTPDIVVIELGANDFWARMRSISELKADLQFMIVKAREKNIKVIIAGVFGNKVDKKNNPIPKVSGINDFGFQILKMERELAHKYKCAHVENIQADLRDPKYWNDTHHPNKAGNEFVALRLLPHIKRSLGK